MQVHPRARQASLIVKEVDDETLVYDLETDKAHCLNDTAARIWKRCDGRTTVREISARLGAELNIKVDEDVVWLALDQLAKFRLLEEAPVKPAHLAGVSRRQAVRALGVAALVLPMVNSLVVPTAAQTASPPPIPPGGCCVSPNQCVSQTCLQEPEGVPPCTPFPPNPQQSGKFCQ
jgi:hypothetical protein